ncbi:MAG: YtxH domain-containing protein [Candidatus Margulisiibacteriota bacterium]|jgi:gas vesicle protein
MSGKKSSFLSGLVIGGLIGGALAIFLAPQSGEKAREWLKKTTDGHQDKIDDIMKKVKYTKEKVIASAREAKDAIDDSLSKLTQTIKEKEKENE